jgi:hypothetical protein
MKKYGRPMIVVTDAFELTLRRCVRSELRTGTKSVAASAIGRRTLINRFDDANAQCNDFEV